jgi:hypothetical protein
MTSLPLAYCGLDCEECPVYIATQTDDDALRQTTARDWSLLYAEYLGKSSLDLEDMNCEGCLPLENRLFVGCQNCPMRACAGIKALSTCAECPEYEACEMLGGFFRANPQAKERLESLRR